MNILPTLCKQGQVAMDSFVRDIHSPNPTPTPTPYPSQGGKKMDFRYFSVFKRFGGGGGGGEWWLTNWGGVGRGVFSGGWG